MAFKQDFKKTAMIMLCVVIFSTSVMAFSIMEATSSFFADIFSPQDGFVSITGYASLAAACTVKSVASCTGLNDVCVAKISSSTNAHLGTPDGSTYNNCVCCVGQDLNNDCTGTYAVVAKLLGNDNSHGAVPETLDVVNYNVNLCLGVTSGTVSCYSGVGGCGPGATCVLKLSDPENAHAEACNQANYNTYLCCEAAGGEMCWVGEEQTEGIVTEDSPPVCTQEGLPCCNIPADAQDGEPTHCSFGRNNDDETGHCCPEGRYYLLGDCVETEQCGYDAGCLYNPETDYVAWAEEEACVNPDIQDACCPNVDWYGEPGNYFVPIHIYTGSE